MVRCFCGIGIVLVAVSLPGCGGGGVTPSELPEEQKSPDYGKNSADEMKNMFGTPGKSAKK